MCQAHIIPSRNRRHVVASRTRAMMEQATVVWGSCGQHPPQERFREQAVGAENAIFDSGIGGHGGMCCLGMQGRMALAHGAAMNSQTRACWRFRCRNPRRAPHYTTVTARAEAPKHPMKVKKDVYMRRIASFLWPRKHANVKSRPSQSAWVNSPAVDNTASALTPCLAPRPGF